MRINKPHAHANSLAHWCRENLDLAGRYVGEPLYEWGFPYGAMQYVSPEFRMNAMRWQREAIRARERVVTGLIQDAMEVSE